MTCQSVIVPNVETVLPDAKISDVMRAIGRHEVPAAAVVDDEGVYVGLFSFNEIVRALLPAATEMLGAEDLSFMLETHDGAADKFHEIAEHPVIDFCNKDKPVIFPDTVFWEGLLLLHKYDGPVAAVEPETNKFLGFITRRSMLVDLQFHTNKNDFTNAQKGT